MKQRYKKLLVSLVVLPLQLFAFSDTDYDGVSDARDYCPNSSFEDIVDKYGCVAGKNITLLIGVELSQGDYGTGTDVSTFGTSFYTSYTKNFWTAALSTSLGLSSSDPADVVGMGDLYTTLSYHGLGNKKRLISLQAGSKIATAQESIGTGENDYSMRISSVFLSKSVNYLVNLGYSLSGDTNTTDFNNIMSTSVGLGKQETKNLYASVSFNYSSPFVEGSDSVMSVSTYFSYSISEDTFMTLSYIYGLTDATADHTLSSNFGIRF